MLDNNLIQYTSSWPFVEIRKLLKDRKDIIKNGITIFLSNEVSIAEITNIIKRANTVKIRCFEKKK